MPIEKLTNKESNLKGPNLQTDEEIFYSQTKISLFLENNNEGTGTLYVTNKRVIWLENSLELGFSVDFPSITCHAIAKQGAFEDLNKPCIYCQLETGNEEEYHDLKIIPEDSNTINEIYDAFSRGAELNPDIEQENEGEFFFNEEEVNNNLQRLENVFQMPTPQEFENITNNHVPGQFDDADEKEDDKDENKMQE